MTTNEDRSPFSDSKEASVRVKGVDTFHGMDYYFVVIVPFKNGINYEAYQFEVRVPEHEEEKIKKLFQL